MCDLAVRYGCKYWLEDHCRAYSPDGVAYRVRNMDCPLGGLPPKISEAPAQKLRVGQQHQKKEKRK